VKPPFIYFGGKTSIAARSRRGRCSTSIPRRRDRNADSNRRRGHQRTTADTSARDLVLPHWSPPLSTAAQDYGSEGWGFESLRARHADQGRYHPVTF
jgi:hypothetical protein